MPADDLALLGARASSSTKQKVWVHGCGNHLTQRGLVLLMCFITSSYHFAGDAKMHLYSLYFSYSPKGSLTHWGRDKMAAISQTTFSNAFSSMKMIEFRLKFQWSLFPRVQLTYSSIGSDIGLAPSRRQAIIWTNDGWFTDAYIRHSASMSLKKISSGQDDSIANP